MTTLTTPEIPANMSTPFQEFLQHHQSRIETCLAQLFHEVEAHDTRLIESMRYSLLNGGKRIRPILAYAAAQACGDINSSTDSFAAALECIHVYSLIHDDLPAMDDDDLRRGKPTNHIAFDEATAILAGDALQTLAFETICQSPAAAQEKVQAVQILARAAGMQGMVMGQAIDLHAVATTPDLPMLERMHLHKTGALIEAAVLLGAVSVQAEPQLQALLQNYAKAIGLAFQVQDDILDVISDTQTLGKVQGADAQRNKPTYVSLLGLEQARIKADELCNDAIKSLAPLGQRAQMLTNLAQYIIQRLH
ncbi:Farnesyl diphosphate synthase [Thalassocella blandensis]|nr:Farnesyl diphosphate synthase [Thalassocella blandensis]